jgi:hypothetical protein
MTSMGEMSAAMMTTAGGSLMSADEGPDEGDLRSAFTVSFTPRRRVFVLAATEAQSVTIVIVEVVSLRFVVLAIR